MVVAVPVETNDGLSARISAHFGHASFYALIDTEDGSLKFISKQSHGRQHGHGCAPVEGLLAEHVERVICGGLGQGAYQRLTSSGIDVRCLSSLPSSVGGLIDALEENALDFANEAALCAGHSHDHAHGDGC